MISGVWFVCSAYVPVFAMCVLSSCLSVLFIVVVCLVNVYVVPLMPNNKRALPATHHTLHLHLIRRRRRGKAARVQQLPLDSLAPPTPSPAPSPRDPGATAAAVVA